MTNALQHLTFKGQKNQRGIAAIEFCLVALFIMVPVFIGMYKYWEILQSQQIVSRATGDATRQVFGALQSPQRVNGAYPTKEQALSAAEAQAQASIQSALIQQYGNDANVPERLQVTLKQIDPSNLELQVNFSRLVEQNNGYKPSFLEPSAIGARSLIKWH